MKNKKLKHSAKVMIETGKNLQSAGESILNGMIGEKTKSEEQQTN